MESIFNIGIKISTPLMLAGFITAAFFLIARTIIKKNIFPQLTSRASVNIFNKLIDRFFLLALAAMCFGFLGFTLDAKPSSNDIDARLDELEKKVQNQSLLSSTSNSTCKLSIDPNLFKKHLETVQLIARASNMDCGERNYWLSILPNATDQQIDRFYSVLFDAALQMEADVIKQKDRK